MYALFISLFFFFFFKQKTAYEMRISDWSSDVCSSDLIGSVLPNRVSKRAVKLIGAAGVFGWGAGFDASVFCSVRLAGRSIFFSAAGVGAPASAAARTGGSGFAEGAVSGSASGEMLPVDSSPVRTPVCRWSAPIQLGRAHV